MSKEKQCECCHEWWYGSDVKESLCPNCYAYFKQLKQQLAESEERFVVANNLRKKSDEVLLNYKTEKYGLDKTIQELRKMKLSMPEKEWYYKGFENCERQMSSHIADLTLEINQLKKQLEEKDKEVAHLKDGLDMCKNIKRYDIGEMLIENAKLKRNQTQLAIQELEKVKEQLDKEIIIMSNFDELKKHLKYLVKIVIDIDQRIKELKGE